MSAGQKLARSLMIAGLSIGAAQFWSDGGWLGVAACVVAALVFTFKDEL